MNRMKSPPSNKYARVSREITRRSRRILHLAGNPHPPSLLILTYQINPAPHTFSKSRHLQHYADL